MIGSVVGAMGCLAFALLATRTGVAVHEANETVETRAAAGASPAASGDAAGVRGPRDVRRRDRHAGKRLGGGLSELRRALSRYGIDDPPWRGVLKSKHVPAQVENLADQGVDLLFVWGGDGTVQKAIDALVGRPVTLAVLPAGTANLFARNLGLPDDLQACVRIGLHGPRREIDVGKINGEHFGVMAGAGLDALMIRDSDGLKDAVGRLAYVWTGVKNVRLEPIPMKIDVDGAAVVPGRRDVRPRGERRRRPRRDPCSPTPAGRRPTADRRRDGGRAMDWARTLGRDQRRRRGIPVRADDERNLLRGAHEEGSCLRARRGRPKGEEEAAYQGEARCDHGLRPEEAAA